jgi:hypothetical protein
MSRMSGSVLLVGSVPGETAAAVLRTCGEGVGKYVTCLPDGETGYRRVWIQFLAATIYHGYPALETIQKPKPIDGVEGALRRLRTARHYIPHFGIATECGRGRRPPETIPELLRIHREVVTAL